jgi:hypothetical protein
MWCLALTEFGHFKVITWQEVPRLPRAVDWMWAILLGWQFAPKATIIPQAKSEEFWALIGSIRSVLWGILPFFLCVD